MSAGEFLSCRTNTYNPYYYFNIGSNFPEPIKGEVIEAMSGFVGESKKSLGKDPLEFRLNPSDCSLAVVSKRNKISEFTVTLDLSRKLKRVNYKKEIIEFYSGGLAGSLLDNSGIRCDIKDSGVLSSIVGLCQKHQSLDDEIRFSNEKQIELLSLLNTKGISNIEGVKIIKAPNYPKEKILKPRAKVIEF